MKDKTKGGRGDARCGCDESAAYLEVLRMIAGWLYTGESSAPGDGGAPCLCDEIDPRDKPCIVCDAREGLVLNEIRRVVKLHHRPLMRGKTTP